jgi:hypothetical protein
MNKQRIDEIRQYLASIDKEIQSFIDSKPSAQEACEVLYGMNMAKRDLSATYDIMSHAVSVVMGEESDVELDDGAKIEKKSAYERRAWQHKDLASVVAQKLVQMSVDIDTGEIINTPEQIAAAVLDYVQPSYWRVKELSKIGVNVDNYCETGVLKTSIIVRKGNSNE